MAVSTTVAKHGRDVQAGSYLVLQKGASAARDAVKLIKRLLQIENTGVIIAAGAGVVAGIVLATRA